MSVFIGRGGLRGGRKENSKCLSLRAGSCRRRTTRKGGEERTAWALWVDAHPECPVVSRHIRREEKKITTGALLFLTGEPSDTEDRRAWGGHGDVQGKRRGESAKGRTTWRTRRTRQDRPPKGGKGGGGRGNIATHRLVPFTSLRGDPRPVEGGKKGEGRAAYPNTADA